MNTKMIGTFATIALLNSACSPKQEEVTNHASTNPGIVSSLAPTSSSLEAMSSSEDMSSSATTASTTPEASNFLDTHWKLIALNNAEVVNSDNAREAHLIFSEDNRVAGSDGCNRISGSYTRTDNQLTFNQMVATKMACEPANNSADVFSQALERVNNFVIHADQLELRDETGLVLARLQATNIPTP